MSEFDVATTSAGEPEQDPISKNPNLEIAQLRFIVNNKDIDRSVKTEKLKVLLQHIKDNEMGPFYEILAAELQLSVDKALLADLKQKNKKRLDEIDTEILTAEQNLGESEVRQAFLKKFEYLCQIGDKDEAVKAFRQTYKKTVGMGYRIDLVFNLIRLGLFFLDHNIINTNIRKAKELMEQGSDLERKNRLLTYEGLYKMSVGDFKAAASLLLDSVPTFGSYELMSYEDLVFYTVLLNLYALETSQFDLKIMQSKEIQEKLTGGGEKFDRIKRYVDGYYNGTYDDFYTLLTEMGNKDLKCDRYIGNYFMFLEEMMSLKMFIYVQQQERTTRAADREELLYQLRNQRAIERRQDLAAFTALNKTKYGYADFFFGMAVGVALAIPGLYPNLNGYIGAGVSLVLIGGSYYAFHRNFR